MAFESQGSTGVSDWTGEGTPFAPLPVAVLPCQFADPSTRSVSELGLVAAILEDALRSISKGNHGRQQRRNFADASRWILDDDRRWPFSFRNVCDLLGIDARALRETVHAEASRPR